MTDHRLSACSIGVTLVVTGCVALTGCGSNSGGGNVPGSAPTPAVVRPIDQTQAGGKAGEPGATVIRMWSYLRDGVLPLAINAYDPDVISRITTHHLLGALSTAQGTVIAYSPRIARTVRLKAPDDTTGQQQRATAVVYVQGRGLQGAVTQVTFLLQRAGGVWSIIYDTMTSNALRTYLTDYHLNRPDPRQRLGSAAASAAASDVVRLYEAQANRLARGYL